MIGVRLQPNQLADLDAWIMKEAAAGRSLSRPEALRRLASEGLKASQARSEESGG